jgi:hypothetical protein
MKTYAMTLIASTHWKQPLLPTGQDEERRSAVKHIRPSDLRFKRRKNLYFHPTDEEAKQLKATAGTWLKRLLMRWHARHAAAMILNSISSTYQFGSYVGDANQQYIHVDADKTQWPIGS